MKLKIYISILFFISGSFLNIHAQKVKIKKGTILLDKKPTAKVSSPFRDHYEFSTLNGEKVFEVDLKGADNGTEEIYHYLEIKSANSTQKAQIEYEVLITSFKVERIIAHLLTVKYKVFTNNGINKEALQKLFQENKKDLDKKYTSIVLESKQKEIERKKRGIEIRNRYYPQVRANKQITFTQVGKVRIVGNITIIPGYDRTNATIKVYDLDRNLVATMNTSNGELASKKYTYTTWDNNSISYTANRYYSTNSNAFLQELIIELIASGYLLEHQITEKRYELRKAQIQLAKENSANIYFKSGIVTDKDGKAYKGAIFIAFQKLDVNNTGNVLPEYGPDNYGQSVYVRYKNKRDQIRLKKIEAKEGVFFNVSKGDNIESYYALKTKGEAFKKLQNINSLKFNNIYFYKLLKKEKNIMLLQDPVEKQKYVLKTSKQKKGFMIDSRSNQQLSEKLATYLSDCKKLSEEIKNQEFDLKIKENLMQIITEYSNCI
ncbi:hypothetical protein JL193_07175 [Polaribacter batillariae]|uniref:Uncharacterized protein n=1 Tax=Polaribacter batillariae TaxID=2808900 RepID=A0ABX7SZT7_9FLAO|nr:hypothetical protein [Polaribacter batillariae]QTD39023.1 hypothetical protein JL193_07175 [Polaribacter batillariae]